MTQSGAITSQPSSAAQWRGVAWMMGAVFSFSAMALCVRELADTLSVYQILFMRSGVGLPLIVAAAALGGGAGLRRLGTATSSFRSAATSSTSSGSSCGSTR